MAALDPIRVNPDSLLDLRGADIYGVSMIDRDGALVYTFEPSFWVQDSFAFVYVPHGITELRITLNKYEGEEKLKIHYLTKGALSELNPAGIYYKNK